MRDAIEVAMACVAEYACGLDPRTTAVLFAPGAGYSESLTGSIIRADRIALLDEVQKRIEAETSGLVPWAVTRTLDAMKEET